MRKVLHCNSVSVEIMTGRVIGIDRRGAKPRLPGSGRSKKGWTGESRRSRVAHRAISFERTRGHFRASSRFRGQHKLALVRFRLLADTH